VDGFVVWNKATAQAKHLLTFQSINQSVYCAQGSSIEYSKQNEYKMKTARENKTTLKNVGKNHKFDLDKLTMF